MENAMDDLSGASDPNRSDGADDEVLLLLLLSASEAGSSCMGVELESKRSLDA